MNTKSPKFIVYLFLAISIGSIAIQVLRPIFETWFPTWPRAAIYGVVGGLVYLGLGVITVFYIRCLERASNGENDK